MSRPQDPGPVESARSELSAILAKSWGVRSSQAKQASDRLAGLEGPANAKDLEKQMEALKRDLETCGAQIKKIFQLLEKNPQTPGSLSEWLKALELPPDVDPESFARTMATEYFRLVERMARAYIHAWEYRQKMLTREALTLQSRVDYAPIAPLVEALAKPITSKADEDAVRKAVRALQDGGTHAEAMRFRPDLPSLLEDARRRLIDRVITG